MRGLVALLLAPCLALAEGLNSASTEQLKARRCWEKTALALTGNPAPAHFGRDDASFPPTFEPELAQLYFGDFAYNPRFASRFAGFVTSKWQREQSTEKAQNVPFLVVQYVVGRQLPWKQVFLGGYDVDFTENRGVVTESPAGLGYFRVAQWRRQYAGNEVAGYKLSTAYRMLNNTLGIRLTAAANNTLGDASAVGRSAAGCTGCHFKGAYPLDLIARVLDRRQGFGDKMTFTPSTDGPQMLWGQKVEDDAQLMALLVGSEGFTFNSCRLAFEFLYGRPESSCEAPIFDACVSALEKEGTIQGALMGMIRHPDYCQ